MDLYAISYKDHHYRFEQPLKVEVYESANGDVSFFVKRYKFLNVTGVDNKDALNKLGKKIHLAIKSGALDIKHELTIC